MDPIAFDITLSKSDYLRLYLWAGYIRGYRAVVTVIAALLSTALLALLLLSLALGLSLDIQMIVLFALPAAIMLIFLASILLSAAKAYRESGMTGATECGIQPTGVIFGNPELQLTVTPDKIKKIYFKKKFIYIAVQGTGYLIIPKSCIPETQYETATGYLEALG